MGFIVVVDDALELARTTAAVLELRGHQTAFALDGIDALQVIARRKPDALITDLAMPRMDGIELMRRVRADPELRGIPVIVATASWDHLPGGDAALHDALVRKPFNSRDLFAALDHVLR